MTSINLLNRLRKGWYERARVRTPIDLELEFDATKADFLIDLLPFHEHPLFKMATDEMQTKILSCGWLIYNAKTIAIETDIVHPLCMMLLNGQFNGQFDFSTRQLITQTIVDEAYHLHLCSYANEITSHHRNISIHLPTFAFIQNMQRLKAAYMEKWKKSIIQLVTAITSEIYITDYLALVSKEKTHDIQPLNSLIVRTHRTDELVHGRIFDHLARITYIALDQKQKEFFAEIMPTPIRWLSDPEFDLWLSTLRQINFPKAVEMINDCKSACRTQNINLMDLNEGMKDLANLAEELGLNNKTYPF